MEKGALVYTGAPFLLVQNAGGCRRAQRPDPADRPSRGITVIYLIVVTYKLSCHVASRPWNRSGPPRSGRRGRRRQGPTAWRYGHHRAHVAAGHEPRSTVVSTPSAAA